MRGENAGGALFALGNDGSSPHARGKLINDHFRLAGQGLIPACAGKTSACVSSWHAGGAHPRMRGENPGTAVEQIWDGGSSPHARGKRFQPGHGPHEDRLIPACAGKTLGP